VPETPATPTTDECSCGHPYVRFVGKNRITTCAWCSKPKPRGFVSPDPVRPTPAPPASEEVLEARVRAAYDMIQALNDGRRKWIMSIPARVDHDPDLVIHVALTALEAEVARLTRELEEARAEASIQRQRANKLLATLSQMCGDA
jgi:hypothetical protein